MQTGIQDQTSHECKVMLEFYRFREVHELFSKGLLDDARIALTELQQRYVTLCDENNLLKQQIKEFEDVLYLSRNLVFDGAVYWLITGEIKQGPFCQDCYNREGLLMRLNDGLSCWHCTQCGWRLQRKSKGTAATSCAGANAGDEQAHEFQESHCLSELDPLLGRAKIISFGNK